MDFLMLLTLTDKGKLGDNAKDGLEAAIRVLEELEGTQKAWFMTLGQYDAVIVGEFPSEESLIGLTGWITEQGYFTVQTLYGFSASQYVVDKRHT